MGRPKGSKNGVRRLVDFTCVQCGKTGTKTPDQAKLPHAKTCSRSCSAKYQWAQGLAGKTGPRARRLTPEEVLERHERYLQYQREYYRKNRHRMKTRQRGYNRSDWLPGEHEKAERALAAAEVHCEICGSDSPKNAKGSWAADHDHNSGRFRGILCTPCNLVLGYMECGSVPMGAEFHTYILKHHKESLSLVS